MAAEKGASDPSPSARPAQDDLPANDHGVFSACSLGASLRIYLPTLVLARTVGLARMLLFGWLILQTEYGLQRLALQLVNVLVAVAQLGVPAGLERYAPHHEQAGCLRHFLRRGLALGLVASAGLTLVLAAGAPLVATLAFETEASGGDAATGSAPGYLVAVTAACLAVTLVLAAYFNVQGILRGLRMYRAVAVMEGLHVATFLVFGVGGLMVTGRVGLSGGGLVRAEGAALVLTVAYGLSLLVTAGWAGWGLRRRLAGWPEQWGRLAQPARATWGRLLRFASFMTGANVVWTILAMFALWYLNKLRGQAEAGRFALPRDLMQAVQLLAMAIWPVAHNSATRLWEQGQRAQAVDQLGAVFRLSGWALWLICAAAALGRSAIVRVMPAAYAATAPLLPWLLAGFLWLSHLGLPAGIALLRERSWMLLVAASVGLAVHVLSAWALVPSAGAIGAAQSAAAAAATAAGCLWLLARPTRDWSSRRELLLLAAPAALLLPSLWASAGQWILGGLTAAVAVLLAGSERLWRGSDRQRLRQGLAENVRVLRSWR